MKTIIYMLLGGCLFFTSCGCDSQAPGDVEEQFDADTINAPNSNDSAIIEQTTPMVTDSNKVDAPNND